MPHVLHASLLPEPGCVLHLQENAAAFAIQLSGEEKAFLEDIFQPEKVTICIHLVCSCKSSIVHRTVVCVVPIRSLCHTTRPDLS